MRAIRGIEAAVLLAALGMQASIACADDTPLREQFAYAMPIEITAPAPQQRIDVPIEVYRVCVDPQLHDLRVLNGAGEIVPFTLRRPPNETVTETALVTLPLFPLRGDASAATAALMLSIDGGKTSLQVQGSPPPTGAPVGAYLVNAGALASPIDSLTFVWPDDAADFSVSATLEVSDDLADWRPLAVRAPLARLRHGGETFEQRRVSFATTRARFWRLSVGRGGELPPMTSVLASPVMGSAPVDRLHLEVPGASVAATPGVYRFDLGAQLPVDRLELLLPDINTVAQVEFFARRAVTDEWRAVARSAIHRLQTADGELTSTALSIAAEPRRYWQVVVDQRGGGIGQSIPHLRAGWLADQLVFVTRGAGPFELVYGSSTAASAETALDVLLPNRAVEILPARTGAPRATGGPARLAPPAPSRPWLIWLLWAALAIGVATLGAVAWNLARQMRATN